MGQTGSSEQTETSPSHEADNFEVPTGPRPRVALLIGNGDYTGKDISKLKNPTNDANALGRTLERKLDFFVISKTNLQTRLDMEKAVDEFVDELIKENAVGFFFYAGHGVTVNGENYLLPSGMPKVELDRDVEYHGMPFEYVLAQLEKAGNNANVICLDCCREDPFIRHTRAIGKRGGLAPPRETKGSIISYACAPGTFAQDSPEMDNSVYTTYLMRHIAHKGLPITQVFINVRKDVLRHTKGKQVTYDCSCLTHDFILVEAATIQATFDQSDSIISEYQDDCWGILTPAPGTVGLSVMHLQDPVETCGRSPDCTYTLPDDARAVSRVHAKLYPPNSPSTGAETAILENLSRNCTWLNGERLKAGARAPLADGDVITIQKKIKKLKTSLISFIVQSLSRDNSSDFDDSKANDLSDPDDSTVDGDDDDADSQTSEKSTSRKRKRAYQDNQASSPKQARI